MTFDENSAAKKKKINNKYIGLPYGFSARGVSLNFGDTTSGVRTPAWPYWISCEIFRDCSRSSRLLPRIMASRVISASLFLYTSPTAINCVYLHTRLSSRPSKVGTNFRSRSLTKGHHAVHLRGHSIQFYFSATSFGSTKPRNDGQLNFSGHMLSGEILSSKCHYENFTYIRLFRIICLNVSQSIIS